jgi:hypothetical protein
MVLMEWKDATPEQAGANLALQGDYDRIFRPYRIFAEHNHKFSIQVTE